ncbi:MAG: flagella synthesis protein FlgN [Pontibacterium sp.]
MSQLLHEKFVEQLTQSSTLLNQLIALLETEHLALTHRDHDAIAKLTTEKTGLLQSFVQANHARCELMREFEFTPDTQGVTALMESAPSKLQPVIKKAWQTLEQQLETLKEKNSVNGQIAARNQKTVERILAIVSGRDGNEKIYNGKGSATPYRAQSRIGKA